MQPPSPVPPDSVPTVRLSRGWLIAFAVALALHVAAGLVGWHDQGFAGHEFRQAQTAISTYYIAVDHNYGLAYPTPVLGKPWSIPMEFPLYEWTVARLSTWFHWPLVETGRGVSLAAFYLTLPAWYLLLGAAGLDPRRRIVALLVVLASPLYIFYSRAFLIESTALLLASWHAWCVVRATQAQHPAWLVGAWIFGAAAALAKVTTWAVVLLPCAGYTLWLVLFARPRSVSASFRAAAWSLAAVIPPLLAGWWWVRTADALKVLNPAAHFLASGPMASFNFGPLALRWSGEFWRQLFEHWNSIVFPVVPLGLVLAAALVPRGRRPGLAVLCLAGFLGSQLLFAHLYFAHSYYFYASGFLLAGAAGLAVGRILEQESWPALLRHGILVAVLAAGTARYVVDYLPRQRVLNPAATGLSQLVQTLTAPDDVIVVFGHDWSAAIPFSARRRALMVPSGTEYETERWQRSLALLADERLTLTLVENPGPSTDPAVRRRLEELRMHPVPIARYRGTMDIYVRRDRLHDAFTTLRGATFTDVALPPNHPAPAGRHEFAAAEHAAGFLMMDPFPARYDTPYEVQPWFEVDNTPVFLAHPPTVLEFAVPPGARLFTLGYAMIPAAYQEHGSDGVGLTVEARTADGATRTLWRARVNPRDEPSDRRRQSARIQMPADARTVILRSDPGPAGQPAYDWVYYWNVSLR